MKIRVFQSDKGDCLLLTSKDGKNILADGGMPASYTKHVAPALGKIRKNGGELDLVYVSHIDADHIAGILKMLDDAMTWKIHDFQVANGNPGKKTPKVVRPPEVKSIWHNSFHDQLEKNAGPIQDMLAAAAPALALRDDLSWAEEEAEEFLNIATSPRQAVLLSKRIGPKQLGIPLNQEYGGGLMYVSDPPDPIKIGSFDITVVGPFGEELKELRKKWNDWLKSTNGKKQIAKIKKSTDKDEKSIGNSELNDLLAPFFGFAEELGDRAAVSAPNLASLMLLVEEKGKTVLLTGDGHPDDLMDGLDFAGKLRPDGTLHVDVLKVLHHGSENNWHAAFGKRLTADEYVFCGDGSHHNPDLNVVKGIIDSRLGSKSKRSRNPEVGNRFRLSFNSSSKTTKTKNKSHMRKLEKLVKARQAKSKGQMKSFFLFSGSEYTIDL